MALPGVSSEPLRAGYDTIIIGAGVQGVAIAYELAKRGHTDVLVIDRSWPGGGASGRNGELIRSAFASREWCDLFELSRQKWLGLSQELGMNVLFNRTGYAVVASTEEQWRQCRADQGFQAGLGIRTELLDEAEARRVLPAANPDLVRGAVLQEQAGFAHHDSVVAAYLENAARLGVQVVAGEAVVGLLFKGDAVVGIRTAGSGEVRARAVVNAAGGQALEINAMAGLEMPLVAARLEMIVTQPVKPFLKPGVAALELLGYCHQTGRGEFVGGTELPRVDESTSLNGTWTVLQDIATKFVRLFPTLAGVRLLRHWAGTVSQTPDLAPVLGPVPEVPGLLLSVGWVYGFMGAPGAAELLADHIISGVTDRRMAPFSIERTRTGDWIREGSLVVDMDLEQER
ncbi:NAD(P)/FAD-dependent oxidoreductase [Leucobacter tenebrionis]|uniref:NAD(P)/FAD-dependent oxidoreductase n=1 Tax=Leucobacter tenebrionis TaxID=2873270 RepID=UPI001CA66CDA|nr:FAD-binding oxidoreductase [Leucobacter tenebrionis]QZY52587.1 FAD-binding oxidoreductase [Leucobacter tenebrionis]